MAVHSPSCASTIRPVQACAAKSVRSLTRTARCQRTWRSPLDSCDNRRHPPSRTSVGRGGGSEAVFPDDEGMRAGVAGT